MTDRGVHVDSGESFTSSTLLERVRQADEAAWRRLVAVYSPLIYLWCRADGLQPNDGVEVGQEVWFAVARNIEKFRREETGDSFRGWLRVITRNKIRDFRRGRKKIPIPEGGSDAVRQLNAIPAVSEESSLEQESNEIQTVYRAALSLVRSEFEEQTWNAFWQVAVENREPAEVAESLGISRNAVYLAKSRILRRLRQEFAGLIEFPAEEPELKE